MLIAGPKKYDEWDEAILEEKENKITQPKKSEKEKDDFEL